MRGGALFARSLHLGSKHATLPLAPFACLNPVPCVCVCSHSHPQGFLRKVVLSTPALKDRYAAVQRERAEAEGDAMDVSA